MAWVIRGLRGMVKPMTAVPANCERPSLDGPGPPFGLQAGGGVDICFLPLDRPVAKLVQRNGRAGNRAADMIAGRKQAEGAIHIMDLRLALAAAHQHSSVLFAKQVGLPRQIGIATLALNPP